MQKRARGERILRLGRVGAVIRVSSERNVSGKNAKIFVSILQTFSQNFAFFSENKFREIFPFSILRKFLIFSRNRLKRNFAKKTKIFAFFASERNANQSEMVAKNFIFSRNDFFFSLETLAVMFK